MNCTYAVAPKPKVCCTLVSHSPTKPHQWGMLPCKALPTQMEAIWGKMSCPRTQTKTSRVALPTFWSLEILLDLLSQRFSEVGCLTVLQTCSIGRPPNFMILKIWDYGKMYIFFATLCKPAKYELRASAAGTKKGGKKDSLFKCFSSDSSSKSCGNGTRSQSVCIIHTSTCQCFPPRPLVELRLDAHEKSKRLSALNALTVAFQSVWCWWLFFALPF